MVNEFEKLFNEVSIGKNRQDIYHEWLEYVIDINTLSLKDNHLDFQGREEYYYRMFGEWVKITNEHICNKDGDVMSGADGWYDYLGTFYQSQIQSSSTKSNSGSFYTPANVCSAMAEMTLELDKDYTNKLMNDSCCGSGRFLLACHSFAPTAIYIGMDLDELACLQAVLNCYIHGVTSSILHMNSISGEFYKGWKVNQYLGIGFPVPHIEPIANYNHAFYYYGRYPCKEQKNNIDMENVIEINKDSDKIKPNVKDIQTTLI
jgi:hypothetical protein